MSELNEKTALEVLQELQDSIEQAAEGTFLTISYKGEESESKTVLLGDLVSLGTTGITYLEAEAEVTDYWDALDSVRLTEPSDVVEVDV
jgi:hypothetical protein